QPAPGAGTSPVTTRYPPVSRRGHNAATFQGGSPMSASACRLGASALAAALAAFVVTPARAELLAHKDLSLDTAVTIATTAAAPCKAQGYKVSVHVVGRGGEVLVALRGDNASPHTMENSMRKAYTARTFRVPSGEIVKRLKENPQFAGVFLTNVIAT